MYYINVCGGFDLDRASEAQEREFLELVSHIRNDAYNEKAFSTDTYNFAQIEFTRDAMAGSNIYEDGVTEPIRQLILAANYVGVSLSGDVEITCDSSDFDNITILIRDNEVIYKNSAIYNADLSSLIKELNDRGYEVKKKAA